MYNKNEFNLNIIYTKQHASFQIQYIRSNDFIQSSWLRKLIRRSVDHNSDVRPIETMVPIEDDGTDFSSLRPPNTGDLNIIPPIVYVEAISHNRKLLIVGAALERTMWTVYEVTGENSWRDQAIVGMKKKSDAWDIF